jgi:predicted ATP-dependent endonuclease of OLD family
MNESKIKISCLQVRGLQKNYTISFKSGLNIICGEISTGKSTILELIDYCLGARSHPEHIELQKKARTALLEVILYKQSLVIQRELFTSSKDAFIHECSIVAAHTLLPQLDHTLLPTIYLALFGRAMNDHHPATLIQSGFAENSLAITTLTM